MTRIPTLDGWRGIAILMVLVSHFQHDILNSSSAYDLGQHGVQLFFVLSGYLITWNLLGEEQINLRAFYVRRVFRILPAALTYLAVLSVVIFLATSKPPGEDIWACLFLFRNYLPGSGPYFLTGHFWSLSLEEQFYLVWPFVLARFGRKRACLTGVSATLAIAVFRTLDWKFCDVGWRFFHTEFRADGLLVGCLLALALSYEPFRVRARKWTLWIFWLALPVFVFDTFRFHRLIPLHESLAIAALLSATSLHPQRFLGRMLQRRPLALTGELSYSIYLWQQLFLRPEWGPVWPFLLVGSFLLSYVLIERPARRFGRKLAARLRPAEVLSAAL